MAEDQMTESEGNQAEVGKKSNAWKRLVLIVLVSFCFVTVCSEMHQRICKKEDKESQVSLTKEDTEGLGWSLARSYAASFGLKDDFDFNYSLEEIEFLRNVSSFVKNSDQKKQLRELMEKSNKGEKLTSEEMKLAKKFKEAEREIYAMVKKKNITKMFCESKKL